MRAERFATLDGLRGIAALAVMALHVCEMTMGITFPSAGSAVDFFFLLSGFVLAHAYPTPGLDYLRARWVRLYPMCLFGVGLGAVLMLSTGITGDWARVLALNLVGLPASGPAAYPYDWPLWSIAFEAVASVAWFAFARVLSLPVLATVVVGLALLGPSDAATWGWAGLLRTLFPFSLGVLLQKVEAPRWIGERFALLSAAVLAILLAIPAVPELPRVVLFAVVLTMGRAEPPAELRTAAAYLGRLSFPLYAVHWPIAWWASRHGLHGVWGALIASAASLIVAYLVVRFYDEPVRRWLMRVTAQRVRVAQAA